MLALPLCSSTLAHIFLTLRCRGSRPIFYGPSIGWPTVASSPGSGSLLMVRYCPRLVFAAIFFFFQKYFDLGEYAYAL